MVPSPLRIGVRTKQNRCSGREWELLAYLRKDIRSLIFNQPADMQQPAIFDARVEVVPCFDPFQGRGNKTLARLPNFRRLEGQQIGQMISGHALGALEWSDLLWLKLVDFEFLFSQTFFQ